MTGSQQVTISVSNIKNVDVIIDNVDLKVVEKEASLDYVLTRIALATNQLKCDLVTTLSMVCLACRVFWPNLCNFSPNFHLEFDQSFI